MKMRLVLWCGVVFFLGSLLAAEIGLWHLTQNGRYALHIIPPVVIDRETGETTDTRLLILDTRTGDVTERHGSIYTVTRTNGETDVNRLRRGRAPK